jgi:hypothetical protein
MARWGVIERRGTSVASLWLAATGWPSEVAAEVRMALTHAFEETGQARIRQDRKFREELPREGVETCSR